MKKNLLAILAVICCMQFSFAADRSLSFDDLYGGEAAVDPATGVITFTSQWWPVAGWNFDTAISKDEYTGVKITFSEAVTATLINLKINYVGGGEQFISINKGSTVLIADFTDDVKSIGFQSSNWIKPGEVDAFPTEPPFPSITLEEAILIGVFETEKEPLLLENLVPTGENTVDNATGVVTFASNWNPLSWTFDPAKSNDTYIGVQINFAEPIASGYLQLLVKYVDVEKEFILGIEKESTFVSLSFTGDVEAIRLQNGDWSGEEPKEPPFPMAKIAEAYLLKKVSDTAIIPVVNTENALVDVYNIMGIKVRSQISREDAMRTLPKGIYIMNNKKVLIRK